MSLVKCGVTRVRGADGAKDSLSKERKCSISCIALRRALNSIHRIDDFDAEEIGAGFFSKIYKVVHKVTKQVMVLKYNTKDGNEANVRREIDMLNRLSHPNIIKFYGVCISNGQMHALLEYINGGSLDQLLQDHTIHLAWTLRVHLACDIAKGLKYLHSNGYMHRDLTSKNILIKRYSDGRTAAVVADLGLSNKIPSLVTSPDCIVGSPYWMAPECINRQQYNQKADVFSYGIILCEIIARVDADPDVLPRTKTFGVDYVKFCSMSSDCPLHFLHQAFICCQIDPCKRPSFKKIVNNLQILKSSAQVAVILADLNRLGIVNNGKNILNRMLLEKILDEKLKQRKLTVPDEPSNKAKPHRSPHHRSSSFLPLSPTHQPPSTAITSTCSATSQHQEQNITPTITTAPDSNQTEMLLLNVQAKSEENQLSPIVPSLNYVPVTPMIVGKVMSRDDVYYAPHPGNPFPVRLRTDKLVESFKKDDSNVVEVFEGTNQCTKAPSKLNKGALFKPPDSILMDCSAYLELHPPPSVSHRESPRNIFFPSILCPPLFSSNMASLSAILNKSLKSPTFPVRLFRSNSLPATPTTFLTNISDESRTRSIYEMSPVTPEEENVLGGKMGACGLASYIKTTIPSCCPRLSNRASYRKPNCFHTSTITNPLSSPNRQHSIVQQPKKSLSHRIKAIIDNAYISTSSSVDSALGKEEVSAGMVKRRFRLKKNKTFHAFSRPGHHALHKTKNIYTDDEEEEDDDDDYIQEKTKIKFEFKESPSCELKEIFKEKKNVKSYKNTLTNQPHTDTKPVLAVKNCNENGTGAFQRFNFRTSSAVVCRSASAIYHHHPFTEQGILSWYFEEWIRKASKHRKTCVVDEDGPRSKNEECAFELNDKSSIGDEDSDDDSMEENKSCKSDDDYDDDYFSSSLCNHQVNNSGCSHGSFYSLDDNLYPSSSSCAENSTTGSWAPDVDLGRDDPKRRSNKEKFLELVKNWEDRSEETKRKVCENELCSFHNHTNIHDISKGKHCSLHFPLSNPYLKPMEFAEFYLYRRFQELKQKWEQNQQC